MEEGADEISADSVARGAKHLANGNLLAALLNEVSGHSNKSQQRDKNGKEREDGEDAHDAGLLLIHLGYLLIEVRRLLRQVLMINFLVSLLYQSVGFLLVAFHLDEYIVRKIVVRDLVEQVNHRHLIVSIVHINGVKVEIIQNPVDLLSLVSLVIAECPFIRFQLHYRVEVGRHKELDGIALRKLRLHLDAQQRQVILVRIKALAAHSLLANVSHLVESAQERRAQAHGNLLDWCQLLQVFLKEIGFAGILWNTDFHHALGVIAQRGIDEVPYLAAADECYGNENDGDGVLHHDEHLAEQHLGLAAEGASNHVDGFHARLDNRRQDTRQYTYCQHNAYQQQQVDGDEQLGDGDVGVQQLTGIRNGSPCQQHGKNN